MKESRLIVSKDTKVFYNGITRFESVLYVFWLDNKAIKSTTMLYRNGKKVATMRSKSSKCIINHFVAF